MTYKTHTKFGLFLYLIFIIYIGISIKVLPFALISIFASLLPDIDHFKSFISNKKVLMWCAFLIMFLLLEIDLYKILWIIAWYYLSKMSGHRNFSHSIFSIILFFPVFYLTGTYVYFAIGYLSHLIADMISGGVSLFYPLVKQRIGINLIKTDSFIEYVFGVLLIISIIILIIIYIIPSFL